MKPAADLLLTNAIVLTMDEALQQYEPGAVAISRENILAVGPEPDLLAGFDSRERYESYRGCATRPGREVRE